MQYNKQFKYKKRHMKRRIRRE